MTTYISKFARDLLANNPGWRDEAKCKEADPSLFDHPQRDEDIAATVHEYCQGCPVKAHCGYYGVQTRATGIWGGTMLVGGRPQ